MLFCRMVNSQFPMVKIRFPDTQIVDLFCFRILMFTSVQKCGDLMPKIKSMHRFSDVGIVGSSHTAKAQQQNWPSHFARI